MYASRQPHPDLPAIPEEAATPTSTTASSNHETPVEAETEIEEIDFACGDDSSNAESLANSYAFTLDNVGFDEESSLVGSVVGSVIGASGTATAVHTPPSVYSPDRISKHERKLHRETCRTLGLPYSEDSSPSSGSDNKEDSVFGDVSLSSGSADELERKRKIDKMWPWPTKASDENSGGYAMPLDKMQTNVSVDDKTESSSNSRLGKITETTSTYTNRLKGAIASFNERIEEAYEKSKQNAGKNNTNQGDEEGLSNNVSRNDDSPSISKPKKARILLPPGWVDSYKNTNSMTKLTIGTTILFMLLCIIVILATLGVSKSAGPKPSWKDDGTDIVADLDQILDKINTSVDSGSTAAPVPDEISALAKSPTTPSLLPSYTPTVTPTGSSAAMLPVSDEPCIDKQGKFRNARGKRRECHWLTIHNAYELYTQRLDDECGALGEMSELALNCRYTCRGYNGCPLSGESEGMVLVEKGDAAEESSGSISMVQPVPEEPSLETNFPTDSTSNPETYRPTTSTPTGSPSMDILVETPSVSVEEVTQLDNANLPTFIDIRGRERQCWWLDIRNEAQRQIRRDANCVDPMVQAMCPSSCASYTKMTAMNGQVATSGSGQAISQAVTFAAMLGGGNTNGNDATAGTTPTMSLETITKGDVTAETTPTVLLETINTTYVELVPQEPPDEMCSDDQGYYLNHHGQPKQCSWLINSQDPTDETRRIRNCGYHGSAYAEGTDLGRMCKSTCGTCGL